MATKLSTVQMILTVVGILGTIAGAITILLQFWQPKPPTTGSS